MDLRVDGVRVAEGLSADLSARVTALAASEMHLYLSSFSPGDSSVQADFAAAEATFTGYAAVTPTYSAVLNDADGGKVSITSRILFARTADGPTESIGGMWHETAGGVIENYFPFESPVNITLSGDYIAGTVGIREPRPDTFQMET